VTTSRKLAYLALTINAIIWGSAFAIVKPVFDHISPLQYLYFRFLTAGVLSLPIFLYYYYKIHLKISYILKVLLIELLGTALPLYILYEGLSRTSALEASLIGATGPIFVILGGIWFLRERESRREWQGLVISLTGSLLLIFEPIWNGHGLVGSSLLGNLAILGYNFLFMIYALIAKKFYKKHPPLYLGSLTYLFTALIYGLILFSQNSLPSYELLAISHVLIPILYMAIPGGILAFALYLYAQSKIEVSEANLFTYLNGVVAIPATYFLLGEKPSFLTLLAILIIAYGVIRAEKTRN
jgi:drug/metabolite transporter (DMT)-like permease